MRSIVCLVVALLVTGARAGDRALHVATDEELRAALAKLRPGDELVLAAGRYRGGLSLANLAAPETGVTLIRGVDAKDPPVIEGGGSGLHLSHCSGVTLRALVFRGAAGNGVNVDDAGILHSPAKDITLEDVTIDDVGPRGNCDALKMSGVQRFAVRNCRFAGWGGSAIDMVGCKGGVVADCVFTGKSGFDSSSGVQTKGGSEDVRIEHCTFLGAGERAINLGGSTGLRFFRPRPGEFEARRITVAGNRFVGSMAPVAFVNADEGRVVRNTFVRPGKWVLRILQEQRAEGFLPCRNGVFEENLVVLDRHVTVAVNVGDATAPDTFTFRRNAWFREGGGSSPLPLPVPEHDAVHGVDPGLADVGTPRMRATSRDPRLQGIGADAHGR